ncbi:MAG: NADH-quinone oxidoreductase subunit I [Candidatus Caenarcaniphilales bacterium]|nr:NADH-quinone oxidoreductase subunit I [Candidatus Caenarcaniphilales bacterium]
MVLDKVFKGAGHIAEGMGTVLKQSTRDPVSTSYPDELPTLYPNSRHRLALNVNPITGEHLCIACKQCERVCPDQCITVIPDPTAKGKVQEFYIDQGLCMFCGLCTEVCPTDCIINTNDFEMSDYSREALVYDIKKLTLSRDQSEFYFDYKGLDLPKPKKATAVSVEEKG